MSMIFKTEEEAWDYWEEAYYLSGGGYEGKGVSFEGRVEMFNDWKEDQGILILDSALSAEIDKWESEGGCSKRIEHDSEDTFKDWINAI